MKKQSKKGNSKKACGRRMASTGLSVKEGLRELHDKAKAVDVAGSFQLANSGNINTMFNNACGLTQSMTSEKSILNITGFQNAYSGNYVGQHVASVDNFGAYGASIEHINTVQEVGKDASGYIQQVQNHMDNMVTAMDQIAIDAGLDPNILFPPISNSGDSGAFAMDVATAGMTGGAVGAAGVATMALDLFHQRRESKADRKAMMEELETAIRQKASEPASLLDPKERQTQQAAQAMVKAMDHKIQLQEIKDAANDVTKLPEVRAAQQTCYQSEQTNDTNSNVKDDTEYKKELTVTEEKAIAPVLDKLEEQGVDLKTAANSCDATGAMLAGDALSQIRVFTLGKNGQLCEEFAKAKEIQMALEKTVPEDLIQPENKVLPPTDTVSVGMRTMMA